MFEILNKINFIFIRCQLKVICDIQTIIETYASKTRYIYVAYVKYCVFFTLSMHQIVNVYSQQKYYVFYSYKYYNYISEFNHLYLNAQFLIDVISLFDIFIIKQQNINENENVINLSIKKLSKVNIPLKRSFINSNLKINCIIYVFMFNSINYIKLRKKII